MMIWNKSRFERNLEYDGTALPNRFMTKCGRAEDVRRDEHIARFDVQGFCWTPGEGHCCITGENDDISGEDT